VKEKAMIGRNVI